MLHNLKSFELKYYIWYSFWASLIYVDPLFCRRGFFYYFWLMDGLLLPLFINSLWIFGFAKLFEHGMIFEKIDLFLIKRISPEKIWILKPIHHCPPCMSSLHGLGGFIFTDLDIIYLPIYIVALTGLNSIINQIIYRWKYLPFLLGWFQSSFWSWSLILWSIGSAMLSTMPWWMVSLIFRG